MEARTSARAGVSSRPPSSSGEQHSAMSAMMAQCCCMWRAHLSRCAPRREAPHRRARRPAQPSLCRQRTTQRCRHFPVPRTASCSSSRSLSSDAGESPSSPSDWEVSPLPPPKAPSRNSSTVLAVAGPGATGAPAPASGQAAPAVGCQEGVAPNSTRRRLSPQHSHLSPPPAASWPPGRQPSAASACSSCAPPGRQAAACA